MAKVEGRQVSISFDGVEISGEDVREVKYQKLDDSNVLPPGSEWHSLEVSYDENSVPLDLINSNVVSMKIGNLWFLPRFECIGLPVKADKTIGYDGTVDISYILKSLQWTDISDQSRTARALRWMYYRSGIVRWLAHRIWKPGADS